MPRISDAKILIISADGFEESELKTPLDKLRRAGATVQIASPGGKPVKAWAEKNWGDTLDADLAIEAVDAARYDALVIPGGQINPDILRRDEKAVALVRRFVDDGKVVAAICHGPWLLVEADALRGRTATSFGSIKTDVKNAGANWVDQEVVTDEGIVTSRSPKDLDAFVGKIIEEIGEGRHDRRRAA